MFNKTIKLSSLEYIVIHLNKNSTEYNNEINQIYNTRSCGLVQNENIT